LLEAEIGTKPPKDKRGAILIPRMINQEDIAAMAGVARENTSRILSEWERRKLVTKIVELLSDR
jgi:CRP-like cAMP-binding protein